MKTLRLFFLYTAEAKIKMTMQPCIRMQNFLSRGNGYGILLKYKQRARRDSNAAQIVPKDADT